MNDKRFRVAIFDVVTIIMGGIRSSHMELPLRRAATID